MMAVFSRLTRLGGERFQKIVNALARGASAAAVARVIQRDWELLQEVSEDTLARQLNRLRTAIINGAFGGELAEDARARAMVQLKELQGSTLDCFIALVAAYELQWQRVLRLRDIERQSGRYLPGLNVAMRQCKDLLITIQKIKFDLGFDEFKRLGSTPEDPFERERETQQRVNEALQIVHEILERKQPPIGTTP